MEPSFSPILVILGLIFTIFGIIVDSEAQYASNLNPPPSPPHRLPPPPSPAAAAATPPSSPLPPPATPPSPPPRSTPPHASRLPRESPLPSPSPPQVSRSPPRSPNSFQNKPSNARRRPPAPPPPPKQGNKLNTGKKIGLLFAGIAAILQIGVVGFLVFKRRQLLKINERYETYSS